MMGEHGDTLKRIEGGEIEIEKLLGRPSLWLSQIINLAHGRPENEFPYLTKGDWRLRLNRHHEIKDAIGVDSLPARRHPDGLNHMATISLTDLMGFVEPRFRARPERWQWLDDFCNRWLAYADLSERAVSADCPIVNPMEVKVPQKRRATKLDRAIQALTEGWPNGDFDEATALERNKWIEQWCKLKGRERPSERQIERALRILRERRTQAVG